MGHAGTRRGPESKLHSCVKCKPNPRDTLSHKSQDVSVVCFPSSVPLHTCVQGKGGALQQSRLPSPQTGQPRAQVLLLGVGDESKNVRSLLPGQVRCHGREHSTEKGT